MEKLVINSGQLRKKYSSCKFIRKRSLALKQSSDFTAFHVAALKKAAILLSLSSRSMADQESFVRKVCEACICGFDIPETPAEEQIVTYVNRFISSHAVEPEDLCTDKVIETITEMKDPRKAAEWVEQRVKQLDFATDKTAEIQARIAAKQVGRYLTCEGRKPLMVYCRSEKIDIGNDIEAVTAPDIIFADKTGIEAVKIRTGKPDVTVRWSKTKISVWTSLELYAMLIYAATAYKNVFGEKAANAAASYYFLRRSDDTSESFDSHFFSFAYVDGEGKKKENSGHNVVSLYGMVAKGTVSESIRENYEPIAKEFRRGTECTEEMCAECPRNEFCNYRKLPIVSSEQKPRLKATEINLSAAQQKVVDFRKGIARVNAGAGAGKTLVVALRTALMIREGIDPASMLLITFTNAGAEEIRERILFYIEDLDVDTNGMNLNVTTFNAFGNDIIQNEYKRFGFKKAPRLIDEVKRKAIIRDLLNGTVIDGLDYRNFTMDFGFAKGALATASELFSIIKRDRLSIYDAETLYEEAKERDLADAIRKQQSENASVLQPYEQILRLYSAYEEKLKNDCLIEYADQEGLIFDLLDMDPYYFDQLGIAHITVDEYQDTSENQNELVKRMCESESFESLLAVGDDSQSIFSFRDARPENIVNFFETFGDGTDMYLMNNYRCSPEIIEFANRVNKRNKMRVDKDLIATRPSQGIPVKILSFDKKQQNYKWIADSIAKKIASGTPASDIEIQAATKNELLEMASVLSEKWIETFVSCPEPMLDNSRIKGIIAMSEAIANPHASKSVLEYCNALCDGSILDMSDAEIQDIAKEYSEKFEQFGLLPEDEKVKLFDSRAEEIAGSDDIAINFVERLTRFKRIADKAKYISDFISLGGEMLKREERLDGVTLSTVHSSKGLEWPIVYIIETKFTSSASISEERRRLLFVAATRAKDELYITGLKTLGRGKTKRQNLMLRQCFEDAGIDPNETEKEA